MELREFKDVFDRFYHPVKNFLFYKLGDVALAEDLVQEVFLKVWEKRDSVRLETVKSLLYTIASNLANNHYTSARARFEFELKENFNHSTQENPQYLLENTEFKERLEKTLANLPENQRMVFLMSSPEVKRTVQDISRSLFRILQSVISIRKKRICLL